MSAVETYTTAVFSTGHLQKETAELLGTEESTFNGVEDVELVYDSNEYGWRVYCGNIPEDCYGFEALPEELKAIMLWAVKNGHRWIEFDRDGDIYEELFPTFDW